MDVNLSTSNQQSEGRNRMEPILHANQHPMNNLTLHDLQRMELMDDRILVRELLPERSPGGIILLTHDKEAQWDRTAVVIKVGPGMVNEPMVLKSGDKVIIGKAAGVSTLFDLPANDDGELVETELLIVRMSGVIAVIESGEEEEPVKESVEQ